MKKRLVGGAIGALLITGGFAFHALTVHATPKQQIVELRKPALQPAAAQFSDAFSAMGKPRTLSIPSLGITSDIRPVGTTPDGAMDIPDSLTDAGWYDKSVNPGNPGKAVLAVHTGYPNKPSEFRALNTIRPNAPITITDDSGAVATFSVIETKTYPAEQAPLGTIFGNSPTARLNIVTCAGKWNPASATYADRLVVFAARTH